MKKFFTNNISWFVVIALGIAAAALFVAIKNRKSLQALPPTGAIWTTEEKEKVMQVCDVENSNTSPSND